MYTGTITHISSLQKLQWGEHHYVPKRHANSALQADQQIPFASAVRHPGEPYTAQGGTRGSFIAVFAIQDVSAKSSVSFSLFDFVSATVHVKDALSTNASAGDFLA